ncbi:hypothetical protein ABWU93_11470 [Xanthomonas translucens pv. translucens]|uniref:AcrVA2 family anti-CRISPR protein n=1 Tax=Xanthomonas campestris pv. translucens TaxID=343 RepID=UPI003F70EF2C
MSKPQFQRRIHRARRILDAAGHAYPQAWGQVDHFRLQRGSTPDFDWPAWCYMPIAGGLACVDPHGIGTPTAVRRGVCLTALATWRMTQGIYRFDPALRDAVLATPLDGDIPDDHLEHLPEWCVYVDLASAELEYDARPLHGAWLHLDYDIARDGGREFRVVFDCARDPRQPYAADGLECFGLPLRGSIAESLEWLGNSARATADAHGIELPAEVLQAMQDQAPHLQRMLALALYLSADADITRRGEPAQPSNPTPTRSGAGRWIMPAAAGPAEWDVGTRIGAALRAAYAREQAGGDAAPTGRHVRPHVRRAHWHTIVSGPRKRDDGVQIDAQDRRRALRWLPPIPVNVADMGALPAVVRPVR